MLYWGIAYFITTTILGIILYSQTKIIKWECCSSACSPLRPCCFRSSAGPPTRAACNSRLRSCLLYTSYENEEFNLLQAALNIEEDMDNLRYNKLIIATDADVDGMHIRLLMMTCFLQVFPDVIRQGHLFVLQTPLFRVRNKKETHYCYSEEDVYKRQCVHTARSANRTRPWPAHRRRWRWGTD